MKRILKSALSIVLALTIIFSSAYVGLSQVDFGGLFAVRAEAVNEGDLTFTLNDDGVSYSVSGSSEVTSAAIVIPSTYNGLPVTSIGDNAFVDCQNLTSIIIPNSVTSIGKSAFRYCYNLKNVKCTNNLNEVKIGAFRSCKNLEKISNTSGINKIGNDAFGGCENLEAIVIGKCLTSLGENVFIGCKKLKTIYYTGTTEDFKSFRSKLAFIILLYGTKTVYNCCPDILEYDLAIDTLTLPDFNMYLSIINIDDQNNFKGKTLSLNGNDIQIKEKAIPIEVNSLQEDNILVIKNTASEFYDTKVKKEFLDNFEETIFFERRKSDTKPYINYVYCKNDTAQSKWKNAFAESIIVPSTSNETFTIEIGATAQAGSIAKYCLAQDGSRTIESNTGSFSNKVIAKCFEPDKPIVAYCIDSKGRTSRAYSTQIKVEISSSDIVACFDSNSINVFSSSGSTFKIDDDVPILGGAEVGFDFAKIPVSLSVDGNKYKVAIGIDKKTFTADEWNMYKKGLDDIKKMDDVTKQYKKLNKECEKNNVKSVKGKCIGKGDFDTNFIGYAEFEFVNGQAVITSSYIGCSMNVKYDWQKKYLVLGYPIYTELGITISTSVSAEGKRIVPNKDVPIQWDIKFNFKPSVTFGVGGGLPSYLSVGISGKAEFDWYQEILEQYAKIDFTLSASVKAKAFLLSYEKEIASKTWNIISGTYDPAGSSLKGRALNYYSNGAPELLNVENYTTLADRDYATQTEWIGGYTPSLFSSRAINVSGYENSLLQTSVYSDSRQQLVEFDGGKMLIWIMDDITRESANRTELVYSLYDEETSTWSEPIAVSDDGTADFLPDVVSDGNNVWVVWQNMNTTFTEDEAILENYSAAADIYVAKYNGDLGKFENAIQVTDDALMDSIPTISAKKGNVSVVWMTNSSNDFFGIEGYNTIKTVSIVNGVASNPKILKKDLNFISSIDCKISNDGKLYVAYSYDIDDDCNNSSDTEVYQLKVSADKITGTRLTENAVLDSNPYYSELNGEDVLVWYSEGNFNQLSLNTDEISTVFAESVGATDIYSIAPSSGEITYILWSQSVDEQVVFYGAVYDGNEWGEPVLLGESSGKALNPSAVVDANGTMFVAYNSVVQEQVTDIIEETGEEFTYYSDVQNDLALLKVYQNSNISLSDDMLEIEAESVFPGDTIPLTVTVKNEGTVTVDAVNIYIDGQLNSTVTVNLLPGKQNEVVINYTVPETVSETTLSIYAEPVSSTDYDSTDNEIAVTYGYTELDVSDVLLSSTAINNIITTRVCNVSAVDSGAFTVTIRENAEDGPVVCSQTCENLTSGEAFLVSQEIKKSLIDFDETGVKKYYIEVVTDSTEYLLGNNNGFAVFTEESNSGVSHELLKETVTENIVNAYAVIKNREFAKYDVYAKIEVLDERGNVIGLKFKKVLLAEKETYTLDEYVQISGDYYETKITIYDVGTNDIILEIPEGVSSIDELAFEDCSDIVKLIVPDSVSSIGGNAFMGCDSLVIFCNNNSSAHTYAVDNNIPFIANDDNTMVNLTSNYIYTDYLNKDTSDIMALSQGLTYSINSDVSGTGVVVDIMKDGTLHSQYTLVVNGDTNGDSVCDVLDCAQVERASSGNADLSGAYAMAADSNSDDMVDITDYQAVVNKALAS